MSRFSDLSKKFSAGIEPTNWGDPGDHRNRRNGQTMVPSTDAKYAKRLPAFRPSVPASSVKAETLAPAKAKAKATAAPKAPVKSLAAQGADAANARILAVMNHTASTGKKKAAAHMLHFSKSSAAEIISKLETAETDAAIEARETWERVIAKQNAAITAINPEAISAADNQPKPPAPTGDAIQDMWARAFAAVGVFV
jgi:hypothetical protein